MRPVGSLTASGARARRAALALALGLAGCRASREVPRPEQIVVTAEPAAPREPRALERALAAWDGLAEPRAGRPLELEQPAQALERGDVDGALDALGTAMSLHPGRSLYAVARGQLELALGYLRAAEADFEHAIELDPENARTWSSLGRTRLGLCLYTRAARAFERAVDLGLDDVEHRLLLSRAYRGCDRGEDALRELGAALDALRLWRGGRLWLTIVELASARPGDVLPLSVFLHPIGLAGSVLALSPEWTPGALEFDLDLLRREVLPWQER